MYRVARQSSPGPRGSVPAGARRPLPWWLWPNLLALDAPAVAVVWQRFLGDVFGVAVPAAASVVLGLVVWGIYLADRVLDARAGTADGDRHRFARGHPRLLAGLAGAAFAAAAVLAPGLPADYFRVGAVISAGVAGYFAAVHLTGSIGGGKEAVVGAVFALGVAVPLLGSEADPAAWGPAVAAFALLCWLNCRLIEGWEARPGDRGGWLADVLIAVAAGAVAALAPAAAALALGLGAGLLLVLHAGRRRVGPRAARVLADLVLLTPIPVWGLV